MGMEIVSSLHSWVKTYFGCFPKKKISNNSSVSKVVRYQFSKYVTKIA